MQKTWLVILLMLVIGQVPAYSQVKIKDLLTQGWAHWDAEDYEKAYLSAKEVLFQDPDNVEGMVLRGVALACNGEHGPALRDLNFAIDEGTKNAKAYLYRGMIYEDRKQRKDALADLNKAVSLDNKSTMALRMRAKTLIGLGAYEAGLADCDQAIRLKPNESRSYYWKGLCHLAMSQIDAAIADFNLEIKHAEVPLAGTYQLLGLCEEAKENSVAALAHYQKAIAINPKFADPWVSIGKMKFVKKDFDGARKDFEQAIHADSSNAKGYGNLGRVMIQQSDFDNALLMLDTAIELKSSELPQDYKSRGDVKMILDRAESAASDYSKAILLNLEFSEAYFGRALARSKMGLLQKAKDDLNMALKINPEFLEAEFLLATIYVQLKDLETARKRLLVYTQKAPEKGEGWAALGGAERHSGQFAKAVEHITKALALGGIDSTAAYYERGGAYRELGDRKAANADFDACLALKPDAQDVMVSMGYELNLMERYQEALTLLNSAIAADSTHPYAFNNRGFAKLKLGQYEASIPDFNKSIALKNDYASWPPHNRGNAYRALGRYEEAIADFTLSLSHQPDFVEALTDRAETYEKIGERDKAKADFEAALKLKPDHAPAIEGMARMAQ